MSISGAEYEMTETKTPEGVSIPKHRSYLPSKGPTRSQSAPSISFIPPKTKTQPINIPKKISQSTDGMTGLLAQSLQNNSSFAFSMSESDSDNDSHESEPELELSADFIPPHEMALEERYGAFYVGSPFDKNGSLSQQMRNRHRK